MSLGVITYIRPCLRVFVKNLNKNEKKKIVLIQVERLNLKKKCRHCRSARTDGK